MHRVVLDTNVIVSALVFGGVPRQIVELIEAGLCSFFYSRDIQLEVRRVLLEKFIWSEERLDDDLAIECALASNADAIVSGDSHLLHLGSYRTIRILSPRDFLTAFFEEYPVL